MPDPFHRESSLYETSSTIPAGVSGGSSPRPGETPAAYVFHLADGALIVFNPRSTSDDASTALEQILSRESRELTGSTIVIDIMGRRFDTGQFLELESVINGVLGARVLQIIDGEWADVLADEGWDPARIRSVGGLLQAYKDEEAEPLGSREPSAGVGGGPASSGGLPPGQAPPGGKGPGGHEPREVEKAPMDPAGPPIPGSREGTGVHGAAQADQGEAPAVGMAARGGSSPKSGRGHREQRATGARAGGGGAPSGRKAGEGGGNAQLLWRTVRSGQRIIYDGNVVIIGDINPGGEVVATGDVIVFGTVRGIAHAGARGDEGAVVAALDLRPIQLRIAYRVGRASDDGPAPPQRSKGALRVARTRGERIVVEEGLRREQAWVKSSS